MASRFGAFAMHLSLPRGSLLSLCNSDRMIRSHILFCNSAFVVSDKTGVLDSLPVFKRCYSCTAVDFQSTSMSLGECRSQIPLCNRYNYYRFLNLWAFSWTFYSAVNINNQQASDLQNHPSTPFPIPLTRF